MQRFFTPTKSFLPPLGANSDLEWNITNPLLKFGLDTEGSKTLVGLIKLFILKNMDIFLSPEEKMNLIEENLVLPNDNEVG